MWKPGTYSLAVAAAAAILLLPVTVAAQGACYVPDANQSAVWLSLEGGIGTSITLPTADRMKVEGATSTYFAGLALNLPKRFSVALTVGHKSYGPSQQSNHHFVKHTDLLVAGRFSPVSSPYIDWSLSLLVGTTKLAAQFKEIAQVQALDDNLNPVFEQATDAFGNPIFDEFGNAVFDESKPVMEDKVVCKRVEGVGVCEKDGPVKRKDIWAVSFGFATRLTYFPIDAVGIFVDLALVYAHMAAFGPDEGPLNLHITAGLAGHF